MSDERIDAPKITKPIQLLASWLAGLIIANGSFLATSVLIKEPTWACGALVVAAIVNVPLFLFCLFLLQTKFRPEMQEDEFYHRYLERRFSTQTGKDEIIVKTELSELPKNYPQRKKRFQVAKAFSGLDSASKFDDVVVTVNDLLPSYSQLIADMLKEGIKPKETFGSTSQDAEKPKHFIVAIGDDITAEVVKKIIEITLKYGLDGVALTGGQDDIWMHHKKIYVGAYSYEEPWHDFLPIEEVKKLLVGQLNDEEFFRKLKKKMAVLSS